MTTLRHPHLSGVVVDVPEEDVTRWVASGWLAPEPAEPTYPAPDPGDTDKEIYPYGE